MNFDALIFDMDGTLLNSLPDLTAVANEVLVRLGFPQHTQEEILALVGNGAYSLMSQAVPASATEEERMTAYQLFKEIYAEKGTQLTEPYKGIIEALTALRAQGVKTAVLSNKFDHGVKILSEAFFPGLFDIALGESDTVPRKPDPTGLLQVVSDLGSTPDRCAYVGDIDTDVTTARAAGTFAVIVNWGYGIEEALVAAAPDARIDDPAELLGLRIP